MLNKKDDAKKIGVAQEENHGIWKPGRVRIIEGWSLKKWKGGN